MVLDVYCACGKLNVANEDMAGQTIHCIRCGRAIQIPAPKPKAEPVVEVVPDIPATRPVGDAAESKESVRDYLYWVLILCLVPLAIGLGQVDSKTFEQRLSETTLTMPPDKQKAVQQTWELIQEGEAGLDALFAQLPEQRLVGAWLARHSQLHWAFVLATSLYVLHFFAPTAIFLQMAEAADATHAPDFFGSLAYYTLAVGLFEEAVKLVPVGYFLYRSRRLEWRQACLVGLASGAGFGIAEGVLYSTSFYHGISTPQNYLELLCLVCHAARRLERVGRGQPVPLPGHRPRHLPLGRGGRAGVAGEGQGCAALHGGKRARDRLCWAGAGGPARAGGGHVPARPL